MTTPTRRTAQISQSIQRARERVGFSRAELARRVGVQGSTITHYETGEQTPSVHTLDRIAAALGTTIDGLLQTTRID